MATLLVVASDRVTAELVAALFHRNGSRHETAVARTPDEARTVLRSRPVDLMLVHASADVPAMIRTVRDVPGGSPPVVALGVRSGDGDGRRAPGGGVEAFVRGDATVTELVRVVGTILDGERRRAR